MARRPTSGSPGKPAKLRRGPAPRGTAPARESPRPRHEETLLRIAGLPAVRSLFACRPDDVERLFFDRASAPLLAEECRLLALGRKPYRCVAEEELAKLAGTTQHHGVVALARARPVLALDIGEAKGWAAAGETVLVLDGVGNPHNLGAVARTAAFFGVKRLVLSDDPRQALPSGAAYRVAEGGLDQVAVYRAAALPATLRVLARDFRVVGTGPRGTSLLGRARSKRPLVIVLGNEEEGLSAATLAACDDVVAITGAGGLESLNVSAAAAILVYEAVRPKSGG